MSDRVQRAIGSRKEGRGGGGERNKGKKIDERRMRILGNRQPIMIMDTARAIILELSRRVSYHALMSPFSVPDAPRHGDRIPRGDDGETTKRKTAKSVRQHRSGKVITLARGSATASRREAKGRSLISYPRIRTDIRGLVSSCEIRWLGVPTSGDTALIER